MTAKKIRATSDKDVIDHLITEWGEEQPELDPSAMAIVGRIMRLGAIFEADAETTLKPFGLRYTDFDILATLRRSGPPYSMPPSQLCEMVVLTSGAMTTALDRLEGQKLIVRESDKRDRRIKAAKLTALGRKIALKATKERFITAKTETASLSEPEFNRLVELLKKLTNRN